MVRAGIIGYLRVQPDRTRAEIARELELPTGTATTAIVGLVEAGLLLPDPPRDVATRGQWVRYRVNDAAVSELYLQLGQAIGEI
jgi:DNA-binding MarR family transcriptional regulator